MMKRGTVFACVLAATTAPVAWAQILVYDENSANSYALTAAERIRPGEVTRGMAADFNALLTGGTWELVVLDYPSNQVAGGHQPLVDYVAAGGLAIISTWHNIYLTDNLLQTFGATGGSSISTAGQTLESAGTPVAEAVFEGVSMPHSTWFSRWGSDGTAFLTAPGTEQIALLAGMDNPVMILANEGRTIASFVIDEWDGRDSAEQVWENMMNFLLDGAPGCYADCDESGALDFFDFLCFQNAFAAGEAYADCDGSGGLDFFDFLCFQDEFAAGCP